MIETILEGEEETTPGTPAEGESEGGDQGGEGMPSGEPTNRLNDGEGEESGGEEQAA